MTTFIQLHLLTSYPPANLNRDDLGRPKTAKMGGVERLRISSQSLKRAWRTSDLFEEALAGHIGTRTKMIGVQVYEKFLNAGINQIDAKTWAKSIAEVFGKLKAKNEKSDKEENLDLQIEQLVHISPEEKTAIDKVVAYCIANKAMPGEELKLLTKNRQAVDIALFGRMLADDPSQNIEAAAQVAHAISVHPAVVEDDFFTAVDDLNTIGAGHLGETGFGAALFYIYICINHDLLTQHLEGNKNLINKTLSALMEAAVKIPPLGKQNSFASRAYASYVMAEIGQQQPRSLSIAFLKPIRGEDYLKDSVAALKAHKNAIDSVYGPCSEKFYELNAVEGKGQIQDLISFCNQAVSLDPLNNESLILA